MKNDDRMTARRTARFALAGCAALLPLSIAWAAAPPQQTPQSEAPEKPSTAQETPKPEAPEQKTPKPVETPKEEPAKTGQDETGKPGDDSELDEVEADIRSETDLARDLSRSSQEVKRSTSSWSKAE